MEKIIKGDELMLFKGEKSIAYATSHTLTVNGNTIDISSKDHGYWGASEVGNITWEITSENLYTDSYYGDLFDAMVSRNQLSVAFGFASNWNINGLVDATNAEYTLDKTKTYYTGKVYVTSLTANANSGENATISITLTGCGALTKVGGTASTSYDDGDTGNTNSGATGGNPL